MKPWDGALVQVARGWFEGSVRYPAWGGRTVEGKETVVTVAYGFGAQQSDKLRGVDDLKRRLRHGATAVRPPINLRSRGDVVQMCDSFRPWGESRPLAMAKANHVDASKQLPQVETDELAAVAAHRNPVDGSRYGVPPRTRLFGSTHLASALTVCLAR